jgi:chemotaxis protein methyltransferase CheR
MREKSRPIKELIFRLKAIDISKYDDSFLFKSLQKRITETNSVSEQAYYSLLNQDTKECLAFMASLNICYTEFFRNPLTFSVLERIVLPSIVSRNTNSNRKEIRMWSAACAAGHETYSLAMLFEELKNINSNKINFRIFASDQDDAQVSEALEGQYTDADLANVNLKRIKQWFVKNGSKYTVKQEIKKNVDFSVFDLFNPQSYCPPSSIFGDFDLVMCANLLFYYKSDYQKIILNKIENCLANKGYLITGETERDILIKNNYIEVFPQSAIFVKR